MMSDVAEADVFAHLRDFRASMCTKPVDADGLDLYLERIGIMAMRSTDRAVELWRATALEWNHRLGLMSIWSPAGTLVEN